MLTGGRWGGYQAREGPLPTMTEMRMVQTNGCSPMAGLVALLTSPFRLLLRLGGRLKRDIFDIVGVARWICEL